LELQPRDELTHVAAASSQRHGSQRSEQIVRSPSIDAAHSLHALDESNRTLESRKRGTRGLAVQIRYALRVMPQRRVKVRPANAHAFQCQHQHAKPRKGAKRRERLG
jgi:hypothetical protein